MRDRDAIGSGGPDPLDPDDDAARAGFEILSDELRLDVLRALAAHRRDNPDDPALGFADLRRAVGRPDSGNFNYHLGELEGRFVRKSDEGYRITAAGLRVVAVVIVGVYGGGERFGSEPLDETCPVCEEALSATYEDGLLTVTCTNDHEFRNALPSGVVDERGLDELVELFTLRTHQDLELGVEGICPVCYAQLEWAVDPAFDAGFPHFTEQCSRCGASVEVPAVAPLFTRPEVVAFYHDHGIDVRRRPPWAPEFYSGVRVETPSTDPVRVRVEVELDGDVLAATLDGGLSVVDIRVER